jgi:hypothetical protein
MGNALGENMFHKDNESRRGGEAAMERVGVSRQGTEKQVAGASETKDAT